MENDDSALPTIVVPGPEHRERIDKLAGRLCRYDKRKAEAKVTGILARPDRNAFLFLDPSHIFYPYYLSKLTEYRQHPELAPEAGGKAAEAAKKKGGAEGGESGGGGAAAAAAATTTRVGGVVRTEGGTGTAARDHQREELLQQTELEARRYLEDPFPNCYSLDLKTGTVDVSAMLLDVMTCTAQYVAKYGEPFLAAVQSRQKNPTFRFLQPNDIRHRTFRSLVEAYRRILAADADETETRLEKMQQAEYVLDTVCADKLRYARSALARRKAALLTDHELRARLHWATFKVVKSFTLSDLMLDGPLPERRPAPAAPTRGAAAGSRPPSATGGGGAPAYAPVFMSSSLVTSSDPTQAPRSAGGAAGRHGRPAPHRGPPGARVVEHYVPKAAAPVRRGVEYFVDAETGERVPIGNMQQQQQQGGGGPSSGAGLKRDRSELGLASEDAMARELQRRAVNR